LIDAKKKSGGGALVGKGCGRFRIPGLAPIPWGPYGTDEALPYVYKVNPQENLKSERRKIFIRATARGMGASSSRNSSVCKVRNTGQRPRKTNKRAAGEKSNSILSQKMENQALKAYRLAKSPGGNRERQGTRVLKRRKEHMAFKRVNVVSPLGGG